MRVFVAGATGAVGRKLVPALTDRGHEVVALTRSAAKAPALEKLGATPVVADALDADAVMTAIRAAEPDAIVHQLSALPQKGNFRTFERDFALTNRLRTEGTDHLLAAARATGVTRFVAQSFGGWPYAREGGPVKTEDDPLDPHPYPAMRATLEAIKELESKTVAAGGLALRYGIFYGPGTGIGAGGSIVEDVRKRRVPIVGDGAGVWSLLHVDDVAGATVAALEQGDAGVYNVADDEPAPVAEIIPALAEALGAKPPRHVPRWVGRLAVGPQGVGMMTEVRGISNAKAKRELRWEPRWPTWRDGFRRGL